MTLGERLLEYVEQDCGAPIIFEEVNWTRWDELDLDDPYRALARKLVSVGYLDPALRVKFIAEDLAAKGNMTGVILYNHGFGNCSMADRCFAKHLREELNNLAIPFLVLDGDCMDPAIDPCSTFTKVRAFVEALNTRKYGNLFGKINKSMQARPEASRPRVGDGLELVSAGRGRDAAG